MNSPKIPTDTKEMTKKYSITKGGICGQACLAMIEQITIEEVMNNWKNLGLEFKGWSGWNQLKDYLKKRGYQVKQKNSEVEFNSETQYIARVQWIGKGENKEKPFYGWGHWSEASANTHFITIINNEWIFCNETGILKLERLTEYLVHHGGIITSYMEVRGENGSRI